MSTLTRGIRGYFYAWAVIGFLLRICVECKDIDGLLPCQTYCLVPTFLIPLCFGILLAFFGKDDSEKHALMFNPWLPIRVFGGIWCAETVFFAWILFRGICAESTIFVAIHYKVLVDIALVWSTLVTNWFMLVLLAIMVRQAVRSVRDESRSISPQHTECPKED